jgi:hypothetical protein
MSKNTIIFLTHQRKKTISGEFKRYLSNEIPNDAKYSPIDCPADEYDSLCRRLHPERKSG